MREKKGDLVEGIEKNVISCHVTIDIDIASSILHETHVQPVPVL